ncbi:PREDICTED: uncharacterized protein LOC106818726 [Priapulus caudatus]|uniref:Uncharacterized protein LOC106818726 n=1 Tax=Priapulus caudatus TaxID=37621 RepID=A0ABM1F365_PRICU|nr:PREDICTED: uncharacterized protein LOC106818726 [Priapulus caudatus]
MTVASPGGQLYEATRDPSISVLRVVNEAADIEVGLWIIDIINADELLEAKAMIFVHCWSDGEVPVKLNMHTNTAEIDGEGLIVNVELSGSAVAMRAVATEVHAAVHDPAGGTTVVQLFDNGIGNM